MDKQYTYLLLNAATVFFPLVLSFDKKVAFFKKWKFIWPGLLLTGMLYLIWDYIFTINNVWSFNAEYIIGFKIFDLPIEEILFFITVPFACIFIYECLICYFKIIINIKIIKLISALLLILCAVLLCFYGNRLYSLINFSTLLVLLSFTLLKKTDLKMDNFYVSYLVSLIPFYIINGLLTALPVVLYNNEENMHFRIGTIPFEDHFYSMSLFLMNLLFFEYFRNRNAKSA